MAEKAFDFWREKDRQAQQNHQVDKGKQQPNSSIHSPLSPSLSSLISPDVALELSYRPASTPIGRNLGRNRPHSIATLSLPRNHSTGSIREGTPANIGSSSGSISPGVTTSPQSAPSTLLNQQLSRHQSINSHSFVSYIDGPISQHQSPTIQEVMSSVSRTRASPVVSKFKRNRLSSLAQQQQSRQLFKQRSFMINHMLLELDDYWKMVHSISQEPINKQSYLTSPTIIRHTPSPRGATIDSLRSSSSKHIPNTVTMAVETGLAIKGSDGAVIIQCKTSGTVCNVVEETFGMCLHNNIPVPHPPSSFANYMLKVCGRDEYMENDRCLKDYNYVHQCIKLSIPVHVVLVERSLVKQLVSNTGIIKPETTSNSPPPLSQDEITILYDSYISKDEEFRYQMTKPPLNYIRHYQQVTACIKMLCERAGSIEPLCVSESIFNLKRACRSAMGRDSFAANIAVDLEQIDGGWSSINASSLREEQKDAVRDVTNALDIVKTSVHETVDAYCQNMNTPYEPVWVDSKEERLVDGEQKLRVKLCGLHRVLVQEMYHYDSFQIDMCMYYGGRAICKNVASPKAKLSKGFFPTITWNKWMNTYVALHKLPRETRISFTLYGLTPSNTAERNYNPIKQPLAWVSLRLFSSQGHLISGLQLLGMWKDESPADPTDTTSNDILNKKSMVLEVYFENNNEFYMYNAPVAVSPNSARPFRPTPPITVANNIQEIANKERFERLLPSDNKLIWTHCWSIPYLLSSHARGLPTLLQSVPNWYGEDLKLLYLVLLKWPSEVIPEYGLEILDGQFPDGVVRKKAVEIISNLSEDDFIDLLPQLVQSLKYDNYLNSPLSKLLLEKVVSSPRIAHYLYWSLLSLSTDSRFGYKYHQLMLALQVLCGEEMAMEFSQQADLIHSLSDVAMLVKGAKDQQRQTTLVHQLQRLASSLNPTFRLPINPALQCCDIDIENCSFFNSKTVPLKLSFKNVDPFGTNIDIMFKAGDDLRQDMLAQQLIKLMDKIWLRAGLDLRLITYQVLSTGDEQGLVELVKDSSTLRQIQTEHGLTGSFKDKPLSEWLLRHNSSDVAWKQATENFTHSCAGYCVATYVLGICDRHNDNIMVSKSGHMFHIDFGRILGNAQMFGAIKRDRAPFVLTPDMAYVINAGDKPSVQFQKFTDLCCVAFNELRKHSHLFLTSLSLLLSSGIPELSSVDDIMYVRNNLLPNSTDEEATHYFTKNIEASLGTIATQINFFIHNLAQFKFSSSPASQGLLSFSPSSYSIATDGKVEQATVVAYYMRYYPEKFIIYQIQVVRADPVHQDTIIFRRYSEFHELHSKLAECFPNESNLPQLPRKKYMPGQSYSRETSESRQILLNMYLESLLNMDISVSESDIVYTFLHCLMRDEHDLKTMREEELAANDAFVGKVKLDLRYSEDSKRLTIMVQHVRELVPKDGSESIDPYVKLYLLPDPTKSTKKKTKVARKTLNPTYNEMFHYELDSIQIHRRCLQLTVWDASSLLSKECLGCVLIELQPMYNDIVRGLVTWFDLQPASLINR